MQRIERHIENLLLNHDCVIVPSIGGFVTRYEEAFFSEDASEILPPQLSISFNAQLRANDGLLTQSYMTHYDTNFPRAQQMVDQDALEIRDQLHANGEYHFENLGSLRLMQSGGMLFIPANNFGISSPQMYGLECAPIIINNVGECEAKEEVPQSVEPTQILEEKPSAETTKKASDSQHYVIRISKSAVRYCVASVAAAILYFIFTIAPSSCPTIDNKLIEATVFGANSKSSAPHCTAAEPKAKDKEISAILIKADSLTEACAVDSPLINREIEKDAKVSVAPEASCSYTIVLASAVSQKGAANLIENLRKNGFDEAEFVSNGKMNRVVYSSYTSNQEAVQALKQLRQRSEEFESAWVMKR